MSAISEFVGLEIRFCGLRCEQRSTFSETNRFTLPLRRNLFLQFRQSFGLGNLQGFHTASVGCCRSRERLRLCFIADTRNPTGVRVRVEVSRGKSRQAPAGGAIDAAPSSRPVLRATGGRLACTDVHWNATSAKLLSLRLCNCSGRCCRSNSIARMPIRKC